MSLLSKLRKVKSFFILIVPEQSSDTKSHKFSLSGIIVFLLGYSLLVSFLGYVFFSITPINELFFPKEKIFSEQEVARLNELNDRMISLSNELENLKSTNQRLRQAIMLGDSSILESLDVKRDTTSFTKKVGGSILSIIKEIFFSGTDDKKKIDYFVKPVNGFISREFNSEKGHIGIDFVVKTGTPVFAAANGYLDKWPEKAVSEYESQMLEEMSASKPEYLREIKDNGKIGDELNTKLKAFLDEFQTKFQPSV